MKARFTPWWHLAVALLLGLLAGGFLEFLTEQANIYLLGVPWFISVILLLVGGQYPDHEQGVIPCLFGAYGLVWRPAAAEPAACADRILQVRCYPVCHSNSSMHSRCYFWHRRREVVQEASVPRA